MIEKPTPGAQATGGFSLVEHSRRSWNTSLARKSFTWPVASARVGSLGTSTTGREINHYTPTKARIVTHACYRRPLT